MKKNNTSIDLEENRFGMFITNDSYMLDINEARNYLISDINSTIKLHRINIIESKTHSLYGQTKSKDKKFFSPIKLTARVTVNKSNQSAYGNDNGMIRDDTGPIDVSIFIDELSELGIDINRGDIIEYNMSGDKPRFYEVDNANNITDTTEATFGGFKPVFRRISGVPVKGDLANLM